MTARLLDQIMAIAAHEANASQRAFDNRALVLATMAHLRDEIEKRDPYEALTVCAQEMEKIRHDR